MSAVKQQFSETFFKKMLKERFGYDVEKVSNIRTHYVVPPGENYICELHRIVVDFSKKGSNDTQTISCIVKNLLENEFVKIIDAEMNVHSCELSIYEDVLPVLETLGTGIKLAPKTYFLSKSSKILMMEDLSGSNYKLANRHEGLNLEHCLLCIEKLAYFHASSLVMYEQDPKIMDRYNKGLFYKFKAIEKLISVNFQELLNVCQRKPELVQYHKKLTENLKERCFTSTQIDPKFNVLNHGDFWTNNLMFQYDEEGKLENVSFIDFQVAVFTSPFFDLHYFIASSPDMEVRKNHIDTILNSYYDAFSKYLQLLKVDVNIPSRKQFHEGFRDKAYIGFSAMCLCLHLIKATKKEGASIKTFLESDAEGSFRHHCFNNTIYLKTLESLFPFYDSLGVFDN